MVAAAVLTTALVGTGIGASATDFGPDTTTLQRDADALLPLGAPGVLVGLATPEGTAEVRSGLGDVAAGPPVPWDAHFRIGSTTKTFVATTALQLVGEGRLALDDTVEEWLPGIVTGNGNDGAAVTVRQLLQHTSGLPDYVGKLPLVASQDGFEQERFTTVTPQEAVALALQDPPTSAPGTAWSYSNTNYALAGMIIESVTGNRWQDEVQARIVAPLGLDDTYTPGTTASVPDRHAIGYERWPGAGATPEDPQWGEPIDATEQNPSWGGAAGGMISTTADLNHFMQALVTGELLAPAELAEMQTTVPATAYEAAWPGARYGLGIISIPASCGRYWSHGGDIMGFMTRNGITADGSRSVTVSLNTDSPAREPGVPAPTGEMSAGLVERALCATE